MASRTPSRSGRSGGRSSSSSRGSSRGRTSSGGNKQMPMILAGVGVLGLVLYFVIVSQSSSGKGDSDKSSTSSKPAAAAPSKPSTPTVQLAGAAAGKTPTKPAPALTAEMLGQVQVLLDEATALQNKGATLRTGGDNQGARDVQSQAAEKLETLRTMIDKQLTWQEEADMEGWAQPAEYVTLGNLWTKIAKLEKAVRMGGGTR